MINPNELADRYVAMFNDPDPERRRAAVKELWSAGGVQVLNPPQEVREVADTLAMSPLFESRGHAELEAPTSSSPPRTSSAAAATPPACRTC